MVCMTCTKLKQNEDLSFSQLVLRLGVGFESRNNGKKSKKIKFSHLSFSDRSNNQLNAPHHGNHLWAL